MNKIENISVLFLASWYPSEKKPFNGIFIFKHARAIAQTNNSVTVLSIEEYQGTKMELVETVREGVKQIKVLYPNKPLAINFKSRYKAFMFGFESLRKKQKIDIIHANVLLPAGIIARAIKKKYGIPYVITEHSTIYLPTNTFDLPFYKKPFVRSALKESAAVFPVSRDLKKHLKEFSKDTNFTIVPNVVDTELFSIRNRNDGNLRYLHISNLAEQKNAIELLEVFKQFQEKYPKVSLTIVAEASYEKAEEHIQKLKLNNVELLSGLDEKEVAALMRKHDVFVLFSLTENLPCVLIEAQSCGLVVVSSDVGGVAEIVENESCGILVPSKDKNALLKALEHTVTHFDNYDPHAIRTRAIENYGNDVIAQQYLSNYASILN